eukprot:CAMPEP_0178442582 /NCGR_PEP_ID=MMETSP0689_2-20121128/38272_1 /TAXON_ID=160604 /ORGANISM="Amphidinium massartii, Strain CS-259" /LENGTH=363 /DNA_ID=CAMNT_0020066199 /DNA_START=162 /DNA_END=1253 /DNA_ORIENTATION=-
MLARAKVPAKVHSMERVPTPTRGDSSPPLAVSPMHAAEVAAKGGSTPSSAAAGDAPKARPPLPGRPPQGAPAKAAPGARAAAARPGSEPPRRKRPSVEGSDALPQPSEEEAAPGERGRASASAAAAQPKPKARAASLQKSRVGDAPPPVDKKEMGKVPAYLRRRQEEWAEQKRQADRTPSPQPPPGFRKVPEDERSGTLAVLRARKAEVEQAQRGLPFKIETVGQKQREKELASRLADIDKLIGMFSKKVVFMPADAEPIAASMPPLEPDAHSAPGVAQQAAQGDGAGVREVLHRPNSRGSAGQQQPSRCSRAAAEAAQRREVGGALPWDNFIMAPEQPKLRQIKTEVKVSAPPGGKSTFQLY